MFFNNKRSQERFVDRGYAMSQHRAAVKEFILVLFFFCLVVVFFYGDVIRGEKTFLFSPQLRSMSLPDAPLAEFFHSRDPVIDAGAFDLFIQPLSQVTSRAYRSGEAPLWNPYMGTGAPLSANMQSATFFPPALPLYLWPSPRAWDLYFLFRLLFAAFFTYLFLRQIGLSRNASFSGGIIYALSGHFVLYIINVNLNVQMVLPLLLWCIEKFCQQRSWKNASYVGGAVSLSILGGFPESTFYVLLFSLIYFLFRWFVLGTPHDKRGWGMIVYGAFLGIGLSALLLFPFAEYFLQSWAAHKDTIAGSVNSSLFKFELRSEIAHFVPYFYGGGWNTWNGQSSFNLPHYLGLLPLFFGLFAFSRERRRLVLFFAGTALFYVLINCDLSLFSWVKKLPMIHMTYFWFAESIFVFSMAVLASIGIDRFSEGKATPVHVLAAFGTVILMLGFLYGANWSQIRFFGQEVFTFKQMLLAVGFLLIGSLLVFTLFKFPSRRFLIGLVVAMIIGELYIYHPMNQQRAYDPYPENTIVKKLKEDPDIFRIMVISRKKAREIRRALFFPNYGSAYEIQDLRIIEALYPERFKRFVEQLVTRNMKDRLLGVEPDLDPNNRFLDLLNVKYILVDGGSTWFRLLKNTDAMPRAFVVHQAVAVRDREEAMELLQKNNFDFRHTVILEGDPPALSNVSAPDPSNVHIRFYGLRRIECDVQMGRDGFLILGDTYYPGWRATVDQEETSIYAADFLLRGIYVPTGNHYVVFTYKPLSFIVGLWVTGISLILWIGVVAGSFLIPDRRLLSDRVPEGEKVPTHCQKG